MQENNAVTVGLTGLTGAGKSTVARLFAERGFAVIDADALARSVTEKGSPAFGELVSFFGAEILLPDGSLNRRKLSKIAFSSTEKTQILGNITHPYIIKRMEDAAREQLSGGMDVILDAPLLFECGLDKKCDFTVAVICPREERIERLMKRDNLPREAIETRMVAQSTEEYQTEKSDFIIVNDGKTEIAGQVERIINNIRNGG